ncbi:MAG: InlB B-repeat-containing protein [Candidatus Bathyarchaeota archaeon]|uniref:InlB B-repeat-containing protein n=1 Tax=Candidatus Bathycorpusculum sp. TaxID=2994959 RepID=UPI00282432A8|nr:InlB B-repeat-containing protein [Candidatus Termiticorpusculum sp.]MCL2256798.1 InlB B-repeat-containing protein [Candidatus Termiticorpusculum sp.]MCL2293076.1 InlB B-repeat-containing protein [Candidatus Termiticorpusculum sp.]
MKSIFLKKVFSLLITISMLLTLISALSIPTFASNIDVTITNMTASSIQTSIQNAITATSPGDTITVTGNKVGEDAEIFLNIPTDITVIWKADTQDIYVKFSGGGTFEVTTGGKLAVTGPYKNAIFANPGNVIVSGGTVSAKGNYCQTIAVTIGNVTVSGGTVSANGTMANYGYECEAISIDEGVVTVTGGKVSAIGAIESNAIIVWTSATVAIMGGEVLAESFVDEYVVNLYGNGIVAYLAGTCTGYFETTTVSFNRIVVEVDSLIVPPGYAGTNNGLIQKAGSSLSNVKWDLSGAHPIIDFNNGKYKIEWAMSELPPEPPSTGFSVRLSQTGDVFNTLNEAIAAARVSGYDTFELEVIDDVFEIDNVIINLEHVTIIGAEGKHVIDNCVIKVQQDGSLTLGDNVNTDLLTIKGSVSVTNGMVTVYDGIELQNGGNALVLEGPDAKGAIHGGIINGNYALYMSKGAQISEISGGVFISKQYAVVLTDTGTRIEKISGGAFYQTNADLNYNGQCFLLRDNASVGEISGGYFEAVRDCAMYIIRGGWVDEISGGTFVATRRGLYREPSLGPDYWNSVIRIEADGNIKTGVGTISDGIFSGGAYFGILLINWDYYTNGPQIDLICGGDIQGVVALQPDVGSYIGEINGGKISGSSTGILSVSKIGKIGGDVKIITTAANVALWNYNAHASIDEIYGGTISAMSSVFGSGITNNGVITLISGGTISSVGIFSDAIQNHYTISEISGGTITASAELGNGIANSGIIDMITGGTISATVSSGKASNGITNSGIINMISGGTIIGDNNSIFNTGTGYLNVIIDGVFWGKNDVTFALAHPLAIEPGLMATMGSGRYWSGTGDIFNNEGLVNYPKGYTMSTVLQTVPVTGINDVTFRFLTLNADFGSVYNIYYDLNGGTNAATNPTTYNTTKCPISISDPTRSVYTFTGWIITYDNGTKILSPIRSYVIPEDSFGDVYLNAFWGLDAVKPPIKYTVKYFANWPLGMAGTGNVPVDNYNPYIGGSIVTVLDQDTLSMPGYVFLGWSTNPNSVAPMYVSDSTFTIFSDTELYAVWQEKDNHVSYTVHYYLEGTTLSVFDSKTVSGQVLGASITEHAIIVPSYTMLPPTTVTITLEASDNVIIFYYRANTDIKYTVYYYLQGTTNSVANAKIVTGQVLGASVTENAITIAGYTAVAPTTLTATLNATGNVFVFYYTSNSGGGGQTKPPTSTSPPTSTKPPTSTPTPPTITVSPTVTPPLPTKTPGDGGDDGEGNLPVWALVNLILSLVGVILAVIVTVAVLLQHKQKQKYRQQTQGNSYNVKDKRDKTQINDNNSKEDNETYEMERQRQRRLFWFLLNVVMGIVGIIVFILTEDMSRPMVLVDKWTIVNAIIFIVELIAIALTFKRKNKTKTVSYVVHCYLQGSMTAIAPSKTKFGPIAYDVTEQAPTIDGYTIMSDTAVTLTLDKDAAKNTVIFHYKLDQKKETGEKQKRSN